MKLPKEFLLSELLSHSVKGNATLNYGNGENVWMHPPVHRILGWYSRPSNFDLKRNVWKLNQISQIIDNDIFVKGDPAISDLATLNRFPNLIEANLVNSNGSKIGVIADFLFEMKTGNIKFYLISRSCASLDDLPLIKSSLKYQFINKGKKIINRFDDMKNTATSRLEDWLEEDEDINKKSKFNRNSFYNEEEEIRSFRNKKEDDPWI